MMNQIDRRTFIRRTVQAAIAAAAGGLPALDLLSLPAQAAQAPPLAVRKGQDIPLLVRETISALGGIQNFVKPGEVVVVKPNIGWDRTVELAANTHPGVVKTLVQLCLEAGAKQVRIFDRTCNDERRCYTQSGIRSSMESIRSERVSLEYMDRRAYKELTIKGGQAFDRWEFYMPVIEADRLINVPIAKHHSISQLTLGMKNLMGVIGGNRGRLHHNIAESLSDIASVIHSDLTVVDATRILKANGPQGGRLQDVRVLDTLIASPDIVAADAYATTLFGLSPEQVPTVVAAARRGLGVMDLKQVRMV
ncbi:MAG: DUF362 domain-containing protein [Desulfuromonadales bacterium]|jgi:uncharacterized protein (DUF362 family)|nr:DUF362 domain-containing protein [Desulfuromonadales bacterium]